MGGVLGIVLIVALIALTAWCGRTDETSGNGDNRRSANYYGGG